MWPIVLAFGALGAILAVASRKAGAAEREVISPALPPAVPAALPGAPSVVTPTIPPAISVKKPPPYILPPTIFVPTEPTAPLCTTAEKEFVTNVVKAIGAGTATLDMGLKALPIAIRCHPKTAAILSAYITKAKIKARPKPVPTPKPDVVVPKLVSEKDWPPTRIPMIKGKPAWTLETRRGDYMAIPQFRTVLVLFSELQEAIGGINVDGRIGPGTFTAFKNRMKERGFALYPKSIDSLAANASKYTLILKKGYQPAQVGARGGSHALPFY